MSDSLDVVLQCPHSFQHKARYVFDTLFSAKRITVRYCEDVQRSSDRVTIVYSTALPPIDQKSENCVRVFCAPAACAFFSGSSDVALATLSSDAELVFPDRPDHSCQWEIPFDLIANAFYFLSSWSERVGYAAGLRKTFKDSVFARLRIRQDIVDQYLTILMSKVDNACVACGMAPLPDVDWPNHASFAVVLSHDVDFVPQHYFDQLSAGAKSILRALLKKKSFSEACVTAREWGRAAANGKDPYCCLGDIIKKEKELGAKSSFQVATRRHHRCDVNYDIKSPRVRRLLSPIIENDFDLCLHGSFCSTENMGWYEKEVRLLAKHLAIPLGSRQHFLAFDYDALFTAQEAAGIQYDMSMGYPDQPGPRAGFSFPYFPYCLRKDRPYNVLQISLFLMDVTLAAYLQLKPPEAWPQIESHIRSVQEKRGCFSAVWHPIVFGGARDPGYSDLYWQLVQEVQKLGGTATDGRTINDFWRTIARAYSSFSF